MAYRDPQTPLEPSRRRDWPRLIVSVTLLAFALAAAVVCVRVAMKPDRYEPNCGRLAETTGSTPFGFGLAAVLALAGFTLVALSPWKDDHQ